MAARNAPLMDPIPPMTTTTKQMIRMLFPMPGYTDEMGAAMAPARAANATPMANTMRYRRLMSMPKELIISRLLAPARIIMPSRVRPSTQYSSPATSRHTMEMNRRYTG